MFAVVIPKNVANPTALAPSPPEFDANACSAENNSVSLEWHCPNDGAAVDGYILEIDSGRDDALFKVHIGRRTLCVPY